MKNVSDIAQNKQKAEQAMAEAEKLRKEQERKRWIPFSALVFANVVFLSLDIRALDAVYKITQSELLAGATVLVSGIAALYWWDVLYPHARRHRNAKQEKIALIGVGVGVIVSVALAFVDYIVLGFDPAWLWLLVVTLTGVQGVMLARYWQIDGLIEADAKRQESIASRIDLQDTASDFVAEIDSMAQMLVKLAEIQAKFPGKGQAEKAARAMGYPVLAEMLADDDGDGVPNIVDKTPQGQPAPMQTYNSDVASLLARIEELEKAKTANPTTAGTNKP